MVMGKAAGPAAIEVGKILVVFLYLFPADLPSVDLQFSHLWWWLSAVESVLTRGDPMGSSHVTFHRVFMARYGSRLPGLSSAQIVRALLPLSQICDPPPPPPPHTAFHLQEHSDGPEICHYERSFHRHAAPPNYTHCGFFGDPHLRTFSDDFQTCKVEGAWPLIHNKYLSVQVTNTPVLPGSSATATSKLTIIFKNFQECVDQKMYHAETDELPAAFADGSKNGGDRHGANTLRIVDKVPGQHVEIQARYIGTTIVVRQVGRYLTFAVRMPEEVVNSVEDKDNQDLYLCLHGCPLNQRIDFRTFRARAAEGPAGGGSGGRAPVPAQGFTYQSATAKCKERLPVEDLYFQSCVFDLLTTGDVNFTMAAYYAFEDVKMLHSNKDKFHIFDRTLEVNESNSAVRKPCSLSLCLLNFLALLLWIQCSSVHL
ncbi:RGMA protein, partial [Atractosteus spatula]|nr:RGMA protein [Atractosteus spatula]